MKTGKVRRKRANEKREREGVRERERGGGGEREEGGGERGRERGRERKDKDSDYLTPLCHNHVTNLTFAFQTLPVCRTPAHSCSPPQWPSPYIAHHLQCDHSLQYIANCKRKQCSYDDTFETGIAPICILSIDRCL